MSLGERHLDDESILVVKGMSSLLGGYADRTSELARQLDRYRYTEGTILIVLLLLMCLVGSALVLSGLADKGNTPFVASEGLIVLLLAWTVCFALLALYVSKSRTRRREIERELRRTAFKLVDVFAAVSSIEDALPKDAKWAKTLLRFRLDEAQFVMWTVRHKVEVTSLGDPNEGPTERFRGRRSGHPHPAERARGVADQNDVASTFAKAAPVHTV